MPATLNFQLSFISKMGEEESMGSINLSLYSFWELNWAKLPSGGPNLYVNYTVWLFLSFNLYGAHFKFLYQWIVENSRLHRLKLAHQDHQEAFDRILNLKLQRPFVLPACPFLWASSPLNNTMTEIIGSCKGSHHKINEVQQFIHLLLILS